MNVFIIGLFISTFAIAEAPSHELGSKIEEHKEILDVQDGKKNISLNLIRIRSSLDAGVEIPGVTNAIVSPEIEIFFTK